MSDHFVSVADLPEGGEKFDSDKVSGIRTLALGVGAVGTIISVLILLGVLGEKLQQQYAYSWLFGYSVTFSIVVGAFFWVLLHHAFNAGWGISVRRIWENMARTLPFLLLFGLPFFLTPVQNALWEWMAEHREVSEQMQGGLEHAAPAEVHAAEGAEADAAKAAAPGDEGKAGAHGSHGEESLEDALLHSHRILLYEKYEYLNIPFWTARFLFYLLAMWAVLHFLVKWPLDQEKDGDLKHTFHTRRLACGGLVIFAISVTFWGIDFLKALDYTWFSTMWGVYIFAGCAWASMAVSILILNYLRAEGYMKEVTTGEHYHLMGKLLLAFTIFWAYIAYDQFFLIWYANITEETKFYLIRNTEGWHIVSLLLFVGHFVVPFIALLFVWLKKNPKLIGLVCFWIIFMHLVDHYWIIIPERGISIETPAKVTSDGAFLLDFLALATFAASFAFLFLRNLGEHSLYPWRDPRLQESINVSN